MWETLVQSLGWEDLLEKGMFTHSSILVMKIPWTKEPGGLWVHRVAKSWTHTHIYSFIYFWLHWVFVAVQAFFSYSKQGLLFIEVNSLLTVIASLVEHGL